MRLPSTIFTLLFASALVAQTPAPGGEPLQIAPHPHAAFDPACPVRFSVARRPQGAVAYAGNLSEWARRFGNHTFAQQWQLLQQEPGFDRLTQQQQQQKLDQLSALYRSEPVHHMQGLNVTVANAKNPIANPIAAADLIVHGYPAGSRIIPAAAATEEIAEDFHLAATGGLPLIDSPIQTTRIAVVDWLELTRIQYADGSTWQPSAASRCSASPSLFVLVNATAR